jgi:hypothetical protein
MDYTAGGELFERISEEERFSEGGVTPHYPSMSFEYFIIPYSYSTLVSKSGLNVGSEEAELFVQAHLVVFLDRKLLHFVANRYIRAYALSGWLQHLPVRWSQMRYGHCRPVA